MFLNRIVYASKYKPDDHLNDLKNISKSASKFNLDHSITGILVLGDEYFLQCIEGSRSSVNSLYKKILLDRRNSDAIIIGCNEIDSRAFETWSMECILLTAKKSKIIQKYSPDGQFNPYQMKAATALEFLLDIKNHDAKSVG